MRRAFLTAAAGLLCCAQIAAAAVPHNRFTLRNPSTGAKVTTGSVRFYALGADSSNAANKLNFALDVVNAVWYGNTTMANGDSIRSGFFEGWWTVGSSRTQVTPGEWISGAKAAASWVDARALRAGAIDDSTKMGAGTVGWTRLTVDARDKIGVAAGTVGIVGVYESTGLFVVDSSGGHPRIGILPNGITEDQLAIGCFGSSRMADQAVTIEKVALDGELATADSALFRDANGDFVFRIPDGKFRGVASFTDATSWYRQGFAVSGMTTDYYLVVTANDDNPGANYFWGGCKADSIYIWSSGAQASPIEIGWTAVRRP